MRITHAIPTYKPAWQFGGPIMSVSRLCEALAETGTEVNVLTTNAGLADWPEKSLGVAEIENGVAVTRYKVNRQYGPIQSSALRRALPYILKDTDILHISAIWQPLGIVIQRCCLEMGIPVVSSLRGALSPYSLGQKTWKKMPYYLAVERPLLQRCSAIHVTSAQEAEEIRWQRLKPQIIQVPNPVDLRNYYIDQELRVAVRTSLNIRSETRVLLICGRQHHKKGLDILPGILNRVRRANWALLMVGKDEDGSGEKVEIMLQRMGLGSRIIKRDSMRSNDLRGVYSASDLLLLPSRHENFGNVVIEALACGCNVAISPKTGVAGDLLNSGLHDYGAVLRREEDIWVDWLDSWFKADRRFQQEHSEWCRSRYGSQAIAGQFLASYQDILGCNKARKLK